MWFLLAKALQIFRFDETVQRTKIIKGPHKGLSKCFLPWCAKKKKVQDLTGKFLYVQGLCWRCQLSAETLIMRTIRVQGKCCRELTVWGKALVAVAELRTEHFLGYDSK